MEPVVEREIDLEASPDDVWSVLREPAGWLADEGSLDLRPGGVGRLTEDGVTRQAVVETVEHGDGGRRLVYRWWDEEQGGDSATRVEITLRPSPSGTRVAVRETAITASVTARRAPASVEALRLESRWDLRFLCLACLAWASVAARV